MKLHRLKQALNYLLMINSGKWLATKYFKANINFEEVPSADDINICIENFNEIVYDYFVENHGKADNITDKEKELIQKYKDFSKQQSKSELNKLKKDRKVTPGSI